jgi:hypothetical protein
MALANDNLTVCHVCPQTVLLRNERLPAYIRLSAMQVSGLGSVNSDSSPARWDLLAYSFFFGNGYLESENTLDSSLETSCRVDESCCF